MMSSPTPSLTGWHRLVMGTRTPTIDDGLAARVHDPMWLLARQYQMGEFVGEDAGTPITARVEANVGPITRYHPEGALPAGTSVTGRQVNFRQPLEPVVEGEPVHQRPDPTPRVGAETGLWLRRMLRAIGLDGYADRMTAAFPFLPDTETETPPVDPAGQRYLRLMRGRVPDGRAVYAHVASLLATPADAWTWPAGLDVAATDADAMSQCLTAWAGRYDTLYTEPEPGQNAWDPSRQEYRFAVATHDHDAESVFVADSYHGGRLDWDALSAAPAGVSLGAESADVSQSTINSARVSVTALPAPLTFPGMPAARWWELEDAAVDWGGVSAGPTDLVRMLLIDYTLTYANNWFLIPVDIEPGTFTRITSLVVTDVFGVETVVPTAVTDDWRMYTPTGRDDGLLLLPPVYEMFESAPVEDVRILRDENANLAWGIEYLVEGAAGLPVDRHQAVRAASVEPGSPAAADPADPRYRLATSVPPNWIPFLPIRAEDGTLMLARGRMLTDPDAEPPGPLGAVLEPDDPALRLFDEEVPRSGVRVTRTYQYAIGPRDNHLWLGRRRTTAAHGDARSGLRFDTAESVSGSTDLTADTARRS
jgi:hypothetical protein